MCGICGFVGPDDPRAMRAMLERMAWRGPDGRGVLRCDEQGVSLGHLRLAIVDLSGGAQPMATADGRLSVTFNGEIYNHAELRRELEAKGHRFRTDHCDTEVLLHGWLEWGPALQERLNGMWAFALHDRERATLFLGRDRFGKKPLYYHHRPGFLAFASELAALLEHPEVPAEQSPLGLAKYLSWGFVPAPGTLFSGVRKLPGGACLSLDLKSGTLSERRWWTYRIEPQEPASDDQPTRWAEELRELLDRAVRRRLMADVPLGVFLSGGVDSSAVTALAARHVSGLRTFSVGFTEASFDESAHSLAAASLFGTDHHQQTLSLDAALAEALEGPEAFPGRLDDPQGDSSILPTFLLCRETRRHVTVALGGDGADELFAGYATFKALAAAKAYHALCPRPVHRAVRALAARLPVAHTYMHASFKANKFLAGVGGPMRLWNPLWLGPAGPELTAELTGLSLDPEELYAEAIEAWDASPALGLEDKTLEFYARFYLQECILAKVDRASMLNSLEVRAPFLDIEVADFARRLPYRFKYGKGGGKRILKKALEPLLPPSILNRRKQGFAAPVGKWFHEGRLVIDHARLPGGIGRACLERLEREHRQGLADHRLLLWNLWILSRGTAGTRRTTRSAA